MGLARPLNRLSAERVGRRLTVRYDGFTQVALCKLATGLAHVMKAFPVPGRLAGSPPICCATARLAGVTAKRPPHYLWRQQHLLRFTRLALQLILVKGFRLYSFQLPELKNPGIVIYCHYLLVSRLGNLRACCLPWMW